jgi:hypothetical protein
LIKARGLLQGRIGIEAQTMPAESVHLCASPCRTSSTCTGMSHSKRYK